MIPEDKHVPVRGGFLCAVLDELAQDRPLGHGLRSHGILQLKAVFRQFPALELSCRHDGVAPTPAAAGLNDQIDVFVAQLRVKDLIQVRCGHSVLALQVCSDQIQHDRDSILSFSFQLCVFSARLAADIRIDAGIVRVRSCLGTDGGENGKGRQQDGC